MNTDKAPKNRTANQRNFRREMDAIVSGMQQRNERGTLLLHACCAPCSTSCLELLRRFFDVTVLFYNPNITEQNEYELRLAEEKRLIRMFNETLSEDETAVKILESRYDPASFLEAVRGLEQEPEGGRRCGICFRLRLSEAARVAHDGHFDFFTTTLTVSPLKNAALLNETGEAAAAQFGVSFLPSDFKKKDGFLRSTQLSEQYGLYRQDYCGCVFSKAERSCAKCRAC